jgi:hypothetical protein
VPVVPDGDGAFGDPYVYTPGQGMTGDYWTEQLKSGNVPGIAGGTDPQGWNGLTEEQFAYYQENYARQANFPPSSGDEGGSSSATDTADQLADFMKGISRSLRDMDLSDYQRQFQAVADTLADNIEQATSLGASEEQLNQIRELGRRQAEALAQAERDKVRSFLSELGQDASLSPAERMAEAQRQYDEAFAAARDGLTGADDVTAAARKLLDESMGYYGSGSGYQAILDAIRAGMGNLSFTPAPAPQRMLHRSMARKRSATEGAGAGAVGRQSGAAGKTHRGGSTASRHRVGGTPGGGGLIWESTSLNCASSMIRAFRAIRQSSPQPAICPARRL